MKYPTIETLIEHLEAIVDEYGPGLYVEHANGVLVELEDLVEVVLSENGEPVAITFGTSS